MSGRAALLFDCDGVLADTERDGHLVAFNDTFHELGVPFSWSAEQYAVLLEVGGGKERLRAYLEAHPEHAAAVGQDRDAFVAEAHRRKSARYIELVEDGALPARPGVRRLVEEALAEGWHVAVASTSSERSVEAVLAHVVGAANRARMSGVFAGDVVAHKKPAPDIYRLAVAETNGQPDHVVVVEDSPPGALAAHRAGLTHVVTESHFTRGAAFPHAASVLDHLGDPGAPAALHAGREVRSPAGLVDLAGLGSLLER